MGNSKEPTVSVILPTFNRANILRRSIDSVLGQTYSDFELIIVDDGSSDNTAELVAGVNDPRIKYIKHENNSGLPAARNTGLKHARGRFIAFQDDDDQWLEDRLKVQVSLLNKTDEDTGVVYCDSIKMEQGVKSYLYSPSRSGKSGDLHHDFLMGNFVTVIATLVKRECFLKVGNFDESLPSFEDWDMWLRISKHFKFRYSDEPLVIVHITEGSMTADISKIVRARKLILQKHYNEFMQNRKLLAKNYVQLACELYSIGRMSEGRAYSFKALRIAPFDLRNIIYTALSLLGKSCFVKILSAYKSLKNSVKRKNHLFYK
ncbi:MAG: glycosyltransferase [Candidatus Omnitrophica bacterium]|nr:glycosyltransferase [Candidatus Omnitrophota bacterium]